MTLKEKLDKRAGLVKQARGILDTAEKENRNLSAEDRSKYDALEKDISDLSGTIEIEQRQLELESRVKLGEPSSVNPVTVGKTENNDEKRMMAFRSFIQNGINGMKPEEKRTLTAGEDEKGGFITVPQVFVADLIKDIDEQNIIRPLATVWSLKKSDSLGVPTLDDDVDDAEWTSEISTGNYTDLSFGKRELKTHPLSKKITISRKLLNNSAFPVENFVRQRLAYKFGRTEEKAQMIGNGDSKALGVFVPSDDGIPASRDIAGILSFDTFIDAQHKLKKGYRSKAYWIFHDDILKELRKIKDNENRYIWQPSVQVGIPDRILNNPYLTSEFAPNSMKADDYFAILGDFSYYWILDSWDFEIQRLVELYAEKNKIGFIGRRESDGMPVLKEAFVRIKLPKK